MGLNATLSVISPVEFKKYPAENPAPTVEFDLWGSWGLLESALQELPKPLGAAFRGDMPAAEDFDDDWDAYDAFTTPELVQDVHAALNSVSEEEVIAALISVGMKNRKAEREENLAAFEEVKAAYRQAAEQNAYLRIFIC